MEAETILHYELAAKGHRLWIEPAAKTNHVNFALWKVWIAVTFHNGRVFGASRAANWPLWQRLLFTAASPLIPLVRLYRGMLQLKKVKPKGCSIPLMVPVLGIGVALDGLGQGLGYLVGAGDSSRRLAFYEYRRSDWIQKADKERLFGG